MRRRVGVGDATDCWTRVDEAWWAMGVSARVDVSKSKALPTHNDMGTRGTYRLPSRSCSTAPMKVGKPSSH